MNVPTEEGMEYINALCERERNPSRPDWPSNYHQALIEIPQPMKTQTAAHTAGPYRVTFHGPAFRCHIVAKDKRIACTFGDCEPEEETANANLLASAPALVEALQSIKAMTPDELYDGEHLVYIANALRAAGVEQ